MSDCSTIPALSIRQPWVWAILNAGKRCENREWDPNGGNVSHARRLIGSTILIHAGKGCTAEEYDDALDFIIAASDSIACPPLKAMDRGVLVARATLADVVDTNAGGHRWSRDIGPARRLFCLLCGTSLEGGACPKRDPWAIPGTIGLILADVTPLAAPVPFKGSLGFFHVPASLVGGAS